jgi:hypothetical protein
VTVILKENEDLLFEVDVDVDVDVLVAGLGSFIAPRYQ